MPDRFHTKFLDLDTDVEEKDDSVSVQGRASTTGNEDLVGDIIAEGAFDDTIAELEQRRTAKGAKALIPLLFNHRSDEPVGIVTGLKIEGSDLRMEASMPKSDTFVRDRLTPQLKAGSIGGLSIGFRAKQYEERRDDRGNFEGFTFTKIDLRETSLTPFPANPLADITDVKSDRITSDDLDDLDIRELERRLKSGAPLSSKLAKRLAGLLKAEQRDVASEPPADQCDADPANVQALNDLLSTLTR